MKTVFDQTTREELIQRIKSLDENSTPQWGKMTVYQMLKHCTSEHFSNEDFVHPFFGKLTKEQIGYFAYKHGDHHLQQFNG